MPDMDKVRVEMNAMKEFGSPKSIDTHNDESPGYVQNLTAAKLK